MRKIHNLKELSKTIHQTIIIAFIVIVFLYTLTWMSFKYETHLKEQQASQQEVESTINLFKSNLSEKISLVANSSLFIRYLNSGRVSRENNYASLLRRLDQLHTSTASGVEITTKKGKLLFTHGENTKYYVQLDLCYLNQELNNKYGNCNFYIKLYINKQQLIKRLRELNHHIIECKGSCHIVNVLQGNKFGTFNVDRSTKLTIPLEIKKNGDLFDLLFYIFIILLVFLAFWIFIKTNKTINASLSGPLQYITNSLKSGHLPDNKNFMDELKYLVNQVQLFYDHKDKIEISRIARQAAHDLRSPLITIEVILKKSPRPNEADLHIIKEATRQIHDIINDLVRKNVSTEAINAKQLNSVMLFPILDYVISEKNIEITNKHPEIKFSADLCRESFSTFIQVIPSELKRVLSNLCNNAIDALRNSENPTLKITSKVLDYKVLISVSDNGQGISDTQMKTVFKEGISFKKAGSGLGLYHAQKNIHQWNGGITLQSTPNNGCIANILLPRQDSAQWFSDKIQLFKNSKLIVIDDCQSIHEQWKYRIDSIQNHTIEIISFYKPSEFVKWHASNKPENTHTYLVDYEYTTDETFGLEIMKMITPKSPCFLVTSHGEQLELQQACIALNVHLIPKFFIPHLKISIIEPIPTQAIRPS